MKVLLTNLGNRNIIYKGKTYNELDVSNPKHETFSSFIDWTKKLNDCFEREKENLDINIINPIISSKDMYDLTVLYYSDQSNFNTRVDQDTIYEASIIKNLLIDKYGFAIDQIINVPVTAKVIDNGGLLNFYRTELIKLKKKYTDISVTICDAGGTAQQKMALKVIAEFLLEPNQYKVLYAERNVLVTDVNVNEYRNVINSEQAITLIKRGDYLSAAELLDFSEISNIQKVQQYNWKGKVLAHVNFRFHQNRKDALASLHGMTISNELLKDYQDSKAFSKNAEMSELFGKDWVDITEKLYKAIFLFNMKNYSQSILSFSQFYEYFLEKLLPIILPISDYGNSNAQSLAQFKNFQEIFDQYYAAYLKRKPEFRPRIESVNSGIMIVKALGEESVRNFAKLISPYVHFTDDCKDGIIFLNVSRNQIAHQGKFITQNEIESKLSYYPHILSKSAEIFELSKDDLFKELGGLLENNLRQ